MMERKNRERGILGMEIIPGRKAAYPLQVSGEILEIYQPFLGPLPIAIWLNLRWLSQQELDNADDFMVLLCRYTGLSTEEIAQHCQILNAAGLLDKLSDGTYMVNDPLTKEAFLQHFPKGFEAAATQELEMDIPPVDNADLTAVINIYQKNVGMLGPVQLEKLRYWVEEKQVSAEVVALAVNEMLRTAPSPRIQYLEGILRNWYNDGIRNLSDWMKANKKSKYSKNGKVISYEGCPNATAYKPIQPNLIERWKELYPDECGS